MNIDKKYDRWLRFTDKVTSKKAKRVPVALAFFFVFFVPCNAGFVMDFIPTLGMFALEGAVLVLSMLLAFAYINSVINKISHL